MRKKYGKMKFDDFELFKDPSVDTFICTCNSELENDYISKKACTPLCESETDIMLICGTGLNLVLNNEKSSEVAFLEISNKEYAYHSVKVDFSTIIDSNTLIKSSNSKRFFEKIKFNLIRMNSSGQSVIIGEWIYENSFTNNLSYSCGEMYIQSESFSFTICDKITCHDCYVYKVIATPSLNHYSGRLILLNTEISALIEV